MGDLFVLCGLIQLSSLFLILLLNPPLVPQKLLYKNNVLEIENVAHFFSPHKLHLNVFMLNICTVVHL